MSLQTITSKAQIAALKPGAILNVEIVGEHLTYFNTVDGRPDSFDVPKSCQTRLEEGPTVIQVPSELRYHDDCDPAYAGRPLSRHDRVRIPATVEFVHDETTGKQYPVLKADGDLVTPAE